MVEIIDDYTDGESVVGYNKRVGLDWEKRNLLDNMMGRPVEGKDWLASIVDGLKKKETDGSKLEREG